VEGIGDGSIGPEKLPLGELRDSWIIRQLKTGGENFEMFL
jgi:hypothetical protein